MDKGRALVKKQGGFLMDMGRALGIWGGGWLFINKIMNPLLLTLERVG